MINTLASKLVLELVHAGLRELKDRTDNKIDDTIFDILTNVLHPSEVFGKASMSDGITEEDEALKARWDRDDAEFRASKED